MKIGKASAAVRGPLIILLNRPRTYCHDRARVFIKLCMCAFAGCYKFIVPMRRIVDESVEGQESCLARPASALISHARIGRSIFPSSNLLFLASLLLKPTRSPRQVLKVKKLCYGEFNHCR